jgi:acetate kinase
MPILVINAGSSSIKFAIYADDGLQTIARGEVDGIGAGARLKASCDGAPSVQRPVEATSLADGLRLAIEWIEREFASMRFAAVGHRIVHGGSRFAAPAVLDDAMLDELEALDPLAPLHQPSNLAAARELRVRYPRAMPVACFDTAFHAGWDDRAQRIALPRRFHDDGVRRYGFHGLSYEFLSGRLSVLAPAARRVVLAHLGSGSSICAVRDGRSIDATMGFSVLDGVPMATRCGEIDPGAIFYLQRRYGLGFEAIEHMLYHDCGLKGVSGISGDMRELLASQSTEARQAVDLFAYRCGGAIGSMAAALGGIDALVFSGGIGARASALRASICAQLEFLGIAFDADANARSSGCVSLAGSRVQVLALETDEEIVIARHCRELLASAQQGNASVQQGR